MAKRGRKKKITVKPVTPPTRGSESLKVELRPILKADAFFKAWPFISQGIEKIIGHPESREDMTSVQNEILGGGLLLWLGFINEKYSGFVTTRIVSSITNPSYNWMCIVHAYKKPGTEDVIGVILQKLEEYAMLNNCREIRFYSPRAFERYIAEYGYKPTQVEYKKTLEEGSVKENG